MYTRGSKVSGNWPIFFTAFICHSEEAARVDRGIGKRKRPQKKDISCGNRGLKTISHFLVQTSIFGLDIEKSSFSHYFRKSLYWVYSKDHLWEWKVSLCFLKSFLIILTLIGDLRKKLLRSWLSLSTRPRTQKLRRRSFTELAATTQSQSFSMMSLRSDFPKERLTFQKILTIVILSIAKVSLLFFLECSSVTLFENYSKCCIFEFVNFGIFHQFLSY
mgnify:CR=1 FL=1